MPWFKTTDPKLVVTDPEREIRRQRYIKHLCIDCGTNRHSAGRPRCNDCHKKWARWF